MWIEKVASSIPMGQGEIVNSLSDGTGATVNAPSVAAVVEALENKQDAMTFDQRPTYDSDKPVTSDGILTYLTETFIAEIYPVGSVVAGTSNFNPESSTILGPYTWTQVGTVNVSGTVVYFWKRTS